MLSRNPRTAHTHTHTYICTYTVQGPQQCGAYHFFNNLAPSLPPSILYRPAQRAVIQRIRIKCMSLLNFSCHGQLVGRRRGEGGGTCRRSGSDLLKIAARRQVNDRRVATDDGPGRVEPRLKQPTEQLRQRRQRAKCTELGVAASAAVGVLRWGVATGRRHPAAGRRCPHSHRHRHRHRYT